MEKSIIGSGLKNAGAAADVQRRDDGLFQAEIDAIIRDAEESRLKKMGSYRKRSFAAIFMGLAAVLLAGAGFGWFFLMQYRLAPALLSIAAGVALSVLLHFWAQRPLKAYRSQYKADLMPRFARALGGLRFFPARGISAKILGPTGIVPAYDTYKAEDCFMGVYKGVKVIFSEARLFSRKNKKEPVFDGIFVLLEVAAGLIEGHTIITADRAMVERWAPTRWAKFKPVPVKTGNPALDRFSVYSDTPEAAALFVGEKFLKELAEAGGIFGGAPLSAVLFRGKYVFLAIPCKEDMFEASNIHVPVTTRQHALTCKREIEKLMEIIDIFELYKSGAAASS